MGPGGAAPGRAADDCRVGRGRGHRRAGGCARRRPHSAIFAGPLFGAAKAQLLEGARFMILPSHSEGLPLAVLESWAAGTPTIMTAECNLAQGFAAGAALECGYDPPAIATALERALALGGGEWMAMASAARGLAGGPFSLATLSAEWAGIHLRALAGGRASDA